MADSNGIAEKSDKGLGLDYADRAKAYIPVEPAYSFDRVILPEDIKEENCILIFSRQKNRFDHFRTFPMIFTFHIRITDFQYFFT